jgi:hypothetical protein
MKGRDSKTRVNGTGAIVCRSYCTANNGHEELELFLLLLVLPRRGFSIDIAIDFSAYPSSISRPSCPLWLSLLSD